MLVGRADRVLVDAPCSGLGVISKKPDIKYKDLSDAARLPEVQYAILSEAARYLKPGGVLVYSTCTLAPAAHEGVFGRFLAARGFAFDVARRAIGSSADDDWHA